MNLKELYQLETKRQNAIAKCENDIATLSKQLEKLQKELYDTMGSEGVADAKNEKIADKCVNLKLRIDTAGTLLADLKKQQNPYFTDEDVEKGYLEYRDQANKKAEAIIKDYNMYLDKAAAELKKMYEHRLAARGVKREFKALLINKDKTNYWGQLASIGTGPSEVHMFNERLNKMGLNLIEAGHVFNSDDV